VRTFRQLIVNADDFAETAAITRGILDCFHAGTVRSTSVIVNGEYWPEATAIIRNTPDLDYGLHLNLTSGKPCLPARELQPFLEPDGTFPARTKMIARLLRHRDGLAAIEAELTEQARRLSETGVPLTHINFHDHLFFLPALWRICLAIQDRFSIPFIRRPYQPRSIRHPLSVQSLKRAFLNVWFRDRRVPGTFEVNYVDSLGRDHLEEVYRSILRNCGSVSELVVHPGLTDPARNEGFDARRVFEHDFLSTDRLHSLAWREEVRLIGYRDLPTGPNGVGGMREDG
jgi:predicted glycoside hydrolase/deacetylase ChbG (UPF0249 family)